MKGVGQSYDNYICTDKLSIPRRTSTLAAHWLPAWRPANQIWSWVRVAGQSLQLPPHLELLNWGATAEWSDWGCLESCRTRHPFHEERAVARLSACRRATNRSPVHRTKDLDTQKANLGLLQSMGYQGMGLVYNTFQFTFGQP